MGQKRTNVSLRHQMSSSLRGRQLTPQPASTRRALQFKLVLLGREQVGKSSLVVRYVLDQFTDNLQSTIGAAFQSQTVCLDSALVKFEIWDTAGQEKYHCLTPMYYRGAQAAIIVYDITDEVWVTELKKQVNTAVVIALTGNKTDLHLQRRVPCEDAKTYAKENRLMFFETSAKTGNNVEEVFLTLAKKLAENSEGTVVKARAETICIDHPPEGENTRKACCV
ncbi:ras-related protein Rab-5C-like isoform X2 [Lampetra planeri]